MGTSEKYKNKESGRREFIRSSFRGVTAIAVGGIPVLLSQKTSFGDMVWQINPHKCVQCNRCATHCVLPVSAVKCVNTHSICCCRQWCSGYHWPGADNNSWPGYNQNGETQDNKSKQGRGGHRGGRNKNSRTENNEPRWGGKGRRGTDSENQLCPTGAIKRTSIEGSFYQYTIDESLCIGCAECVKGCNAFGNGSMHLQIRHDLCVNCNECSIAQACPSGAIKRVPADKPYLMKKASEH